VIKQKRAGRVTQVVKCLHSKNEALVQTSVLPKKKKVMIILNFPQLDVVEYTWNLHARPMAQNKDRNKMAAGMSSFSLAFSNSWTQAGSQCFSAKSS
jgi:hypothetical protein